MWSRSYVCHVLPPVHAYGETDESAGEIIEVGPQVTDLKVGDRVASQFERCRISVSSDDALS